MFVYMPRRVKKGKKSEIKSRKRAVKSPKKSKLKVGSDKKTDKTNKDELSLTLKKKDLTIQAADYAKIERNKRMVMWAGVTFFMILILAFWIFNLKTVFRAPVNNASSPQQEFSWSEMTDEFKSTMEQMRKDLDEFSASEETEVERNIFLPVSESTTTSTSSLSAQDKSPLLEEQITQEEIEELRSRLEELEDKLNE